MLQFSANLYRVVRSVASIETTRYYLNGVFVEPARHGVGVFLTATDGHRLLCVHDASGKADESAIIQLSDFALKACKGRNVVSIATGSEMARIHELPRWVDIENVEDLSRLPVLAQSGVESFVVTSTVYDEDYGVECQVTQRIRSNDTCRVDGTFPDYRRVIPYIGSTTPSQWSGGFNGVYVASFGKIAGELSTHFDTGKTGTFRILQDDPSSPALIRFGTANAFGVLMPMRLNVADVGVPQWFLAPPAPPPALAIEDMREAA